MGSKINSQSGEFMVSQQSMPLSTLSFWSIKVMTEGEKLKSVQSVRHCGNMLANQPQDAAEGSEVVLTSSCLNSQRFK